jgi:hypothetical protein
VPYLSALLERPTPTGHRSKEFRPQTHRAIRHARWPRGIKFRLQSDSRDIHECRRPQGRRPPVIRARDLDRDIPEGGDIRPKRWNKMQRFHLSRRLGLS